MPERLRRETAEEEGGLKHRRAGESRLDARRKDAAAGLLLQVLAAAGVVGVGVGYEYGEELPAVFVEYLPDLAARVLVVAAVHQADPALDLEKADFRGAV